VTRRNKGPPAKAEGLFVCPKLANFGFRAEKWRSRKLAQTKHADNHRLEHRMAAIWKRGNSWRVEIRRLGYPKQNRTFVTKAKADAWARQVEAKMDRAGTSPDGPFTCCIYCI
jgi:hypothetical protein